AWADGFVYRRVYFTKLAFSRLEERWEKGILNVRHANMENGLDISGHGHAHTQTVKKYPYSRGAHIHIVVHWSEEKSILYIGT
uniref:hypothetical protein n=1 Tax=Enterocloster clostridioformis TaxID=1531 RepID=UPI0026743C15